MTTKEIMESDYLRSRAIKTVQDSLAVLQGTERKDFAAQALHDFEAAEAPLEVLDELYTIAYN